MLWRGVTPHEDVAGTAQDNCRRDRGRLQMAVQMLSRSEPSDRALAPNFEVERVGGFIHRLLQQHTPPNHCVPKASRDSNRPVPDRGPEHLHGGGHPDHRDDAPRDHTSASPRKPTGEADAPAAGRRPTTGAPGGRPPEPCWAAVGHSRRAALRTASSSNGTEQQSASFRRTFSSFTLILPSAAAATTPAS